MALKSHTKKSLLLPQSSLADSGHAHELQSASRHFSSLARMASQRGPILQPMTEEQLHKILGFR
jgi:hypothetical protein